MQHNLVLTTTAALEVCGVDWRWNELTPDAWATVSLLGLFVFSFY